MVMKANDEVEIVKEDKKEKKPLLKDVDDVCVDYSVKGETFIVRRELNMHVKVDDLEGQNENIFHTRCHIHNKVCNLIIDGGGCTNVASIKLVKRLNLCSIKHHIPYKL
jgi:hypothetical protein